MMNEVSLHRGQKLFIRSHQCSGRTRNENGGHRAAVRTSEAQSEGPSACKGRVQSTLPKALRRSAKGGDDEL